MFEVEVQVVALGLQGVCVCSTGWNREPDLARHTTPDTMAEFEVGPVNTQKAPVVMVEGAIVLSSTCNSGRDKVCVCVRARGEGGEGELLPYSLSLVQAEQRMRGTERE